MTHKNYRFIENLMKVPAPLITFTVFHLLNLIASLHSAEKYSGY